MATSSRLFSLQQAFQANPELAKVAARIRQ